MSTPATFTRQSICPLPDGVSEAHIIGGKSKTARLKRVAQKRPTKLGCLGHHVTDGLFRADVAIYESSVTAFAESSQ